MSDVCDSLGLEGVLAKTRTAKVMCEGQIIEGVVMDRADGYDLTVVRENGNHPMAQIYGSREECTCQSEGREIITIDIF